MTVLVRFSGTSLADGTLLTAGVAGSGDTAVDSVGGTERLTKFTDGTLGAAFSLTPTTNAHARWAVPADSKELGIRYYFRKPTAWSGGAWPVMTGWDLEANTQRFRHTIGGVGQPGQTRFVDATNTAFNSPEGLHGLNTWVRAEVYLQADQNADGTDGDGRWRHLLALGHSRSYVYDSGWNSGATLGTGVDQIRWGAPTGLPASPGTLHLAHLIVTDDADVLIGPSVLKAKRLRRHTGGGALTPVVMSRHTGGGALTRTVVS